MNNFWLFKLLQVAVPYEFHRYIIGQKGMGVREMMNCYDVNIRVPSQEAKSDLVIISGVPSNVEAAKVCNCANTQFEQFYI